MKMPWVFVDLAQDFGGHEVMLLRWLDELHGQGEVEATLVCTAGTRLARLARGRMEICEIERLTERWSSKATRFLQLSHRLYELRRRLRPAVTIVAEGCLMSQRHGLFAAHALNMRPVLYVPIVSPFSQMGLPDAQDLEQRVRQSYGKLPAAWITLTNEQSRELRGWTGADQPMHSLPNTVGLELAAGGQSRSPRNEAATARRPLKALILGRLDAHQKGLDLLLAHVQRQAPDPGEIVLSIVGEGPFGAAIEAARACAPALATLISLEPWQDAAQALRRHDALLITSRFEGVPLVMLEAMALGIPVVSSDLPGTRSYLPPSCLFAIGDLTSAFAILRNLRADESFRASVIRHNSESFSAKASPAVFANAVHELTGALSAGAAQCRSRRRGLTAHGEGAQDPP